MSALLLAVDGGNAKTDLALVARGRQRARARARPGQLAARARRRGRARPHRGAADRGRRATAPVAYAELLLAGVDFPAEVETLQRRARERGWAERVEVANDTFAVLRAGTDRGWGVAVVCGAGINCLGLAPDGRAGALPRARRRSPATGAAARTSARAAVSAAARSEDGRGPRTALEQPRARALRARDAAASSRRRCTRGVISQRRFVELAPIVLAAAADDEVAAEIVARLAAEVVALVRRRARAHRPGRRAGRRRARRRADAGARPAPARRRSSRGSRELGVPHSLAIVDAPPVVGAALRALDTLGAAPEAHARLRSALGADERLAEAVHG